MYGQAIVLLLVLVAMLCVGIWMLFSSRVDREESARRFAAEVAQRVVIQHDERFLNQTLAPRAQVLYPPSWRWRMLETIRSLGPPQSQPSVEGDVYFQSQFFSPIGEFRARVDFASGPGYLDMRFSHPGVRWEIDGLNFTWTPPNAPAPPAPPPGP